MNAFRNLQFQTVVMILFLFLKNLSEIQYENPLNSKILTQLNLPEW